MLFGAIKCNMDGLMRGSPGHAIVEGIFRDHLGGMLAYFSLNVGIQSTFFVEIFGAIIALEMTKEKGWNRTWLECDFTLVIHAFKKPSIVPWQVRYRWKNCLSFCKHIVFFFLSHIFREANSYAYKLVSFGVSSRTTTFWLDSILSFVKEEFLRK